MCVKATGAGAGAGSNTFYRPAGGGGGKTFGETGGGRRGHTNFVDLNENVPSPRPTHT